MVIISGYATPPKIKAYLHQALEPSQLDPAKSAFNFGSLAKYPCKRYDLVIEDRAEFYGKHPAEIRHLLDNEQASKDYFVLIDKYTVIPFEEEGQSKGDGNVIVDKKDPSTLYASTVILVGSPVSSQDTAKTTASLSPPPVYKYRLPIQDLALALVNYDIANMDMLEDMENNGLTISPYDQDQIQPRVQRLGTKFHEHEIASTLIYLIALPGEFEQSDNDPTEVQQAGRPLTSLAARNRAYYRLTDQAARESGLKPRWIIGSTSSVTQQMWERYGQSGTVPEGVVAFAQMLDEKSSIWTES